MEDITLQPGLKMEQEPDVMLINQGSRIMLVKYCMTYDQKRCEGGLFNFTANEWLYFWKNLYKQMTITLQEL